jgi:hypothetical protein
VLEAVSKLGGFGLTLRVDRLKQGATILLRVSQTTSRATCDRRDAGIERQIEVLMSRDELAHACGFPVTRRYGVQRSTRTIAVLRRRDV